MNQVNEQSRHLEKQLEHEQENWYEDDKCRDGQRVWVRGGAEKKDDIVIDEDLQSDTKMDQQEPYDFLWEVLLMQILWLVFAVMCSH